MSFWEDLSSSVKAYLGIGAVLVVLLIGYNSCAGGSDDAPTTPRGYQGGR